MISVAIYNDTSSAPISRHFYCVLPLLCHLIRVLLTERRAAPEMVMWMISVNINCHHHMSLVFGKPVASTTDEPGWDKKNQEYNARTIEYELHDQIFEGMRGGDPIVLSVFWRCRGWLAPLIKYLSTSYLDRWHFTC